MMKRWVYIICFFLTLSGYAQDYSDWSLEQKSDFLKDIDWENDAVWLSVNQQNDSLQALLIIAEECNMPYEKATVLSLIGSSKGRGALFDEAINYFQQSIEIYHSIGHDVYAALNESYIAVEFYSKQEYELAKKYFLKSKDVLKDSGSVDYAEPLIGLADVYLMQDSLGMAEHYLLEFNHLMMPLIDLGGHYYKRYLELMAIIEFKKGHFEMAEQNLLNCLAFDKKEKMVPAIINSYAMLAQVSLYQNKFKRCLGYLDSAQVIIQNTNMDLDIFLRDIYKLKGNVFQQSGKLDSSIYYYKQFHQQKLELESKVSETELNEILAIYEVTELDREALLDKKRMQELNMNKKQKQFVRSRIVFLLIIVLCFGSLIIYFLIKALNRKKQLLLINKELIKAEQQLLENKIAKKKAEGYRLSREVEMKQQELVNFAQEIGRKNHFVGELIKSIKSLMKTNLDEKKLKELIFYVHSSLEVNNSYEELQKSIDENNSRFFNALISQFPKLTSGECHIIGLIRLGLTSKEIAGIRNITVPTIEVARYRIRKKMLLDKNVNLTEYLKEI